MNATAHHAFAVLHESGCFVLPNPWDVGSARYLAHLGYAALATSSAGLAYSKGRPDTVDALPLETVLSHVREIVTATPLPVNVDFQQGYAETAEGVAENVARCVQTGCAGLSIEDASGDEASPLYDRAFAIERVAAARSAIDASGVPVVLTARSEAWLVGVEDPAAVALDRLVAFAEAGADCLYAPGVRDPMAINQIVRAVAPRAVNVLMTPTLGLDVPRLADLGVRRVSVGSAFARIAWGAFDREARAVLETGRYGPTASGLSVGELNEVFAT